MTTSPRFPERCKRLKTILTPRRLRVIWKDHVRGALRQQVVGDIADYHDVHIELDRHITNALDKIFRGVYQPNVPVRVLLEKSKGLCRQLLVPDPIDALILQAMVNSILNDVIANQPNDNAFYQAQAHKITKGRRERIVESEYGSHQSWLAFQKAILNFTKTHDYLVVTDIANFFDYISFSELRNVYGSFQNINEDVLDFIFFILEHYNWRPDYMPNGQLGLPQMNFDAPRLLAHSFLFELDRHLTQAAIGSYARYMDDLDIGVGSIGEGKQILRNIDLVLQTRGVRLNSGKTKIMAARDAATHYYVNENRMLDLVDRSIVRKTRRRNANFGRETSLITKRFATYLRAPGYFDAGNGEKIIKRFLTFFLAHKIALSPATIEEFLFRRPALREYVLRYISHLGFTQLRYTLVRNYLLSTECVDDASIFAATKTIVEFASPNTSTFKNNVRALANSIATRGAVGFASGLWLMAKFGTQDGLMDLISNHYAVWSIDTWAGRQVGSLLARLSSHPTHGRRLLDLIRSSMNAGAQSTYMLHHNLLRGHTPPSMFFQYLKAPNSSHPRRVTFSKILLLRSFLKSPAPSPAQKQQLRISYNSAPLDAVEKYLLNGLL